MEEDDNRGEAGEDKNDCDQEAGEDDDSQHEEAGEDAGDSISVEIVLARDCPEDSSRDQSVQTDQRPMLFGGMTVGLLRDEEFQYYTSFLSYKHFMLFFDCLGPATTCLKYQNKHLRPEDQLLLTLIKLRLKKDDK